MSVTINAFSNSLHHVKHFCMALWGKELQEYGFLFSPSLKNLQFTAASNIVKSVTVIKKTYYLLKERAFLINYM